MDEFERLLANVVINAGEKIIDAASLYKTKYSYRNGWFLTVIAEEELAKIILIPFAKYSDSLEELMKRPSAFYKHPVKQKIFTSYGMQNRQADEIERIKQHCLYVNSLEAANGGMEVISDDVALDELEHAIKLFNQLGIRNIVAAQKVSKDLKEAVLKYASVIFIPAVRDLLPETAEKMAVSLGKSAQSMNLTRLVQENPLVFTEAMTYALTPNDCKMFFRNIQTLTYDEMIKELGKYVS